MVKPKGKKTPAVKEEQVWHCNLCARDVKERFIEITLPSNPKPKEALFKIACCQMCLVAAYHAALDQDVPGLEEI